VDHPVLTGYPEHAFHAIIRSGEQWLVASMNPNDQRTNDVCSAEASTLWWARSAGTEYRIWVGAASGVVVCGSHRNGGRL